MFKYRYKPFSLRGSGSVIDGDFKITEYTNYDEFITSKPIIIYTQQVGVYFLKMFDERKFKKRPNFSFEVNNVKFDYEYSVNQHFYVDTSTIFKMKKDDFINYFKIKDINDFNATNILDSKDVTTILFQTGWLMSQRPPQVVVNYLEISQSDNQLNNYPIYVNHQLFSDIDPDSRPILVFKHYMQNFQNDPKIQHEVFLLGLEIKQFCEDLQTKIELGIDIK